MQAAFQSIWSTYTNHITSKKTMFTDTTHGTEEKKTRILVIYFMIVLIQTEFVYCCQGRCSIPGTVVQGITSPPRRDGSCYQRVRIVGHGVTAAVAGLQAGYT